MGGKRNGKSPHHARTDEREHPKPRTGPGIHDGFMPPPPSGPGDSLAKRTAQRGNLLEYLRALELAEHEGR